MGHRGKQAPERDVGEADVPGRAVSIAVKDDDLQHSVAQRARKLRRTLRVIAKRKGVDILELRCKPAAKRGVHRARVPWKLVLYIGLRVVSAGGHEVCAAVDCDADAGGACGVALRARRKARKRCRLECLLLRQPHLVLAHKWLQGAQHAIRDLRAREPLSFVQCTTLLQGGSRSLLRLHDRQARCCSSQPAGYCCSQHERACLFCWCVWRFWAQITTAAKDCNPKCRTACPCVSCWLNAALLLLAAKNACDAS